MSRKRKSKKEKVPKLTEEEYVKYISALKGEEAPLTAKAKCEGMGRSDKNVLQN